MLNVFIEKTMLSRFKPKDRDVGSDAAVVSVGWSTSSVLTSFLLGISMFTSIEIARAIGSHKPEQVSALASDLCMCIRIAYNCSEYPTRSVSIEIYVIRRG